MSDSPRRTSWPGLLRKIVLLALVSILVLLLMPTAILADEGFATWYGEPFHGRRMANGQVYDMNDPTTTASNLYPFGTWLRVTNPANGKSVTVQVRDRGAFKHAVDLSYAAFTLIENPAKMYIRVLYEVVPGPDVAGAPAAAQLPAPKPAAPPAAPAAAKPAVPASAPAAPAPAKPAVIPSEYVVGLGDTLTRIASRFGLELAAVAKWNGLTDANRIVAGQRLALKAPSEPNAAPPSDRGPSRSAAGGGHRVAAGDTLWELALRYGTTPERLAALNDLDDDSLIVIGQSLRVPESAGGVATPGAATASRKTHLVVAGDTLFGIALDYDTTVSALTKTNGLTDESLLQIGQRLSIP